MSGDQLASLMGALDSSGWSPLGGEAGLGEGHRLFIGQPGFICWLHPHGAGLALVRGCEQFVVGCFMASLVRGPCWGMRPPKVCRPPCPRSGWGSLLGGKAGLGKGLWYSGLWSFQS